MAAGPLFFCDFGANCQICWVILGPIIRLDIFLDLEGDRQAENGGLDYLFGYALQNGAGAPDYEALWALSPREEKEAFERLIDLIIERRAQDPAMHVYHYAPYEPTAMKRMMSRIWELQMIGTILTSRLTHHLPAPLPSTLPPPLIRLD